MRVSKRKTGCLRFEDFRRFISLNPQIEEIELSNDGEIFLNPELSGIIKYAYARDIRLTAGNGVNFNTVSNDMLRTLVEYEFASMTVSIDGSSQETYAKYRRNGNFDRVMANIRKLNEYKLRLQKGAPFLAWQYIILESTDDVAEIERAKTMAAKLHMDIFFKKDNGGYQPRDPDMIKSVCGLSYDKSYSDGWLSHEVSRKWLPCLQLFNMPQLAHDGTFFGCCVLGKALVPMNGFEVPLEQIMSNESVEKIRAMLRGGAVVAESRCVTCQFFKDMVATGNYIQGVEWLP